MKTTKQLITEWRESQQDDGFRPHLGASLIGHECSRHLWYVFRWCVPASFDGRMLRLFDTGQREEQRIIEELRAIGCQVYDRDEKGYQMRVCADYGHFSGSLDAAIKGLPECPDEWMVAEFKTHNEKSFSDLEKNGVTKSKPLHHAQMTIYMGMTKMNHALYFAVNKNTDDIYIEIVEFDKKLFDILTEKAKKIIFAIEPPLRMSEDKTFYKCKQCAHHSICHDNDLPHVSCRTCAHSTPTEQGTWQCSFFDNYELSLENQKAACECHRYIPSLLYNFAEVRDADAKSNYVQYKNKLTGKHFTNGDGTANSLTSQEIKRLDVTLRGDEFISDCKVTFPGTTIEDDDIPF